MIRVLIADDQLVVRSGFRLFLRDAEDIEVVGEARSGVEAVRKARELAADVVLMDIRMPGGDGITATCRLAGPDVTDPVAVIIVTTFDLDEYIVRHEALLFRMEVRDLDCFVVVAAG